AFDGNGFQTAAKDALGNRWTYTRDQYGNLLTAVDPLGNVSSYSYGSTPSLRQVVTMMDARGSVTSFTYLASGLPQDVEDPLGNFRTYVWDNLGQLSATVNPLGFRRTYLYNLVANRMTEIDPLGNR